MLNRSQPHTHTCWWWWGDLPWMTFGKVEEKCSKASDVLQTCLKWHNLEFWKSSSVDLDWSNVVIVVTGIDQAGCYWEVLCRAGHWTPGGCAASWSQDIIYLLCQSCLAPNLFRGWMSECPESTKQLLQQHRTGDLYRPPPSALTTVKKINWN